MTRNEHITQNKKYKRENEQPSFAADKPNRFLNPLEVFFDCHPGRTLS